MGFLPKRVKRERQRTRLRIIALAVLHGFVAIKHRKGSVMRDYTPPWARTVWEVQWPDGKGGHFYDRTTPARMYLHMLRYGDKWVGEYRRGLDVPEH